MDMDDIKKLSPRERIRKLKELEEKRKNEIDEARKLITQSEEEMEVRETKKRDIPIPQLKSVDVSNLFTKEEKEMYKMKRFGEVKDVIEDRIEDEAERIRDEQLEDVLKKEKAMLDQAKPTQYTDHIEQLQNERHELTNLYQMQKENPDNFGYDQMKRVYEIKDHIEHVSQYRSMSDSMAEELNVAERMMNSIRYNR